MKKIIAILLTASMLILFGCSAEIVPDEAKKPTGFVEMDIQMEYLQNAHSICSEDNLIAFMTTIYKDDSGNLVMPHGEGEDEGLSITECVVEYDARENRLIDIFEISDCPLDEIWGLELKDNRIILFSNSEMKNAVYDFDMNWLDLTDRTAEDPRDIAEKSNFYDPDLATVNDGYCYVDGSEGSHYLYYLDDLDTLYICTAYANTYVSNMCQQNANALNNHYTGDASTSVFTVDNYKSAFQINRAEIKASDYGYQFISTAATGIGNEYAVCTEYFSNEDSEDYLIRMLCWDYCNAPTNESLAVEVCKDLNVRSNEIIESISADYGIEIHINEMHESIEPSVRCDEDPKQISLYDSVSTIKKFLDSLPDGMVEEIYSGFSNENREKGSIRIDLVSEITIDASAFAQSFTDPMELCFTFHTAHISNVAHEFMHLLDARIDDYMSSSDRYAFGLTDEWNDINKDFLHEYDINEESHPEYDYDEAHFISFYAATNDTEERAEIFANLYANYDYCRDALKNEAIRSKAELLCRLIRESFPSCANADTLAWEKAIAG